MKEPFTRRAFFAAAAAFAALPARADATIRLGAQTRAFGSPLPDKEAFLSALGDLKAVGYEGYETNFRSLEHSFDNPGPMRAEIEKRGVAMIGLHVSGGLYDPAKIKVEQYEIDRVARAAREFGGGHVIMSGRALPTTADGRAEPAALKSKAREMVVAGKRCQAHGIRFSFHNHNHELQHDAEEIRYCLENTDPAYVSWLFDVGHILRGEISAPALVRQYHQRIAGFHLRDVSDEKEVLMGSGDVDFRGIGEAIHETGWKGWLIVELNRRDDMSSREMIQRAYDHVRESMKI